jgi:hypothetical protein
MTMRWTILAVCATVVALATHAAAAPIRVSVCALVADPVPYVGKRVVVPDAQVFHNGVDISVLKSTDGGCPDAIVGLRWTADRAKLKKLAPLREALFQRGEFGTMGKDIRGDFIGSVRMEHLFDEAGPALQIEDVHNLRVRVAEAPSP